MSPKWCCTYRGSDQNSARISHFRTYSTHTSYVLRNSHAWYMSHLHAMYHKHVLDSLHTLYMPTYVLHTPCVLQAPRTFRTSKAFYLLQIRAARVTYAVHAHIRTKWVTYVLHAPPTCYMLHLRVTRLTLSATCPTYVLYVARNQIFSSTSRLKGPQV